MISRRRLLERIGAIGGLGAAYSAMVMLGLEAPASAQTVAPTLPPAFGKGVRVVILGAGIAGLTAAHELEQAGYFVTVIEARDRVGGRAWTLRDGDTIAMTGEADQTVRFSPGLYMNAGPARIPSFHQGLLGYARKFGVPLEVEVNSSRSAYLMGDDGNRIRMRAAVNDMRGYVSELLSKAINQGALDQAITPTDKEKLLPFLKGYGDLTADGHFKGTQNSGFADYPGAGVHPGRAVAPVPLGTLLANRQLPMAEFEDFLYMQATMFQPVGGMDRIHAGFQRNLRRPATLGAEVIEITQTPRLARVTYRDKASGTVQTIEADYLISTIPYPVLKDIRTDLPPAVKQAIASVPYDYSNKIGFDAPRFWEADQIYGGISFVGGETGLVWYPSGNIFAPRGMLLACYASGEEAEKFQQRPIAEQIAMARAVVDRLHPGHGADLTNGVAVNWHKIPYNLGPWPAWNGVGGRHEEKDIATPAFRLLLKPAGRVYFAGAAMSQTPGWQEGGIQSAWSVIAQIAERARDETPARKDAAA